MHKELSKKEEQTQNVHKVHNRDTKRHLITPVEDKVGSLTHHDSELQQLKRRQTRLPPYRKTLARLGIFGMHTDEVIRVHHRVDESIEQDGKEDVTIVQDIGIQPIE